MQLDRLDEFLEIVAQRGVSAAAAKLHMSPSNLSRHLSELEDELDVQLFYREPSFHLTPAGIAFLNEASRISRIYNSTVVESRAIARQKTETVIVQEYSVDDASSAIRFRMMSLVKARNKLINIEMLQLRKSSPINALKSGGTDIGQTGIVGSVEEFSRRAERDGIIVYPVFQEPLFVCFDNQANIAVKDTVPISDLDDLAVRIPYGHYYSPMREYVSTLYRANGRVPMFSHIEQRSNTLSSFYLFPMNPGDIYIVPESMTHNIWMTKRSDDIRFAKLDCRDCILTTCMMVKKTNKKQSVKVFQDVLEKMKEENLSGNANGNNMDADCNGAQLQ